MLLYSIMPPEQIFASKNESTYEYRPLGTGLVQGVRRNGHFVVERVLSTNPAHYLDPRYAPGGEL